MQLPVETEQRIPQWMQISSSVRLHGSETDTQRSTMECVASNQFHRLGSTEARFVSEVIDHSNVQRAYKATFATLTSADGEHDEAFAHKRLAAMCHWLLTGGLAKPLAEAPRNGQLVTDVPTPTARPNEKYSAASIYFAKFPLCNPDRMLDRVLGSTGWLFSAPAECVKAFLLVVGFVTLLSNWTAFQSDLVRLVTPTRCLHFVIAWLVLKLLHEFSHAIVCKRYGGRVREGGAALILLMPIAYVDVSSGWKFDSKWKRLHVTIAGVLSEFSAAALALLVWQAVDSVSLRSFLVDFVMLASIGSLLFNLNPLLKFDGYFALSDLSGVDNLYALGQSYSQYWGKRYLLGMNATAPTLPLGQAWWIRPYALAASAFRFSTMIGLVVAASYLFHGIGIVVSALGILLFAIQPLIRLLAYLKQAWLTDGLSLPKLAIRFAIVLSIASSALLIAPERLTTSTPGVVQYDPPTVLRAPTEGFISEIPVQNGQHVSAGDIVLVMQNDDLVSESCQLQVELACADQAIRLAKWQHDASALGDAQSQRESVSQQLAEVRQQVEALTIRAPISGKVVGRRLCDALGTYQTTGDELCAIGNDQQKRILLSLTPAQASRYQGWQDRPVKIAVCGLATWRAHVTHIETRASTHVADSSLTAPHGGSLPVIMQDAAAPQLASPRVTAYINLPPQRSETLHCGQRCYVTIPGTARSLAQSWYETLQLSFPTIPFANY